MLRHNRRSQTVTYSKRRRPLLLVRIVLMIIVASILHGVGGMVLLNTGFGEFLLHNPVGYVIIGLFSVIVMF